MSTDVNPPLNLRIPRKLTGDVESDAFFRNLITILFQLWERSGGGDDLVEDSANQNVDTDTLFGLFAQFDELSEELDGIETVRTAQTERYVISTSVDYTTSGSDIVICNDAVTVTLNSTPDDLELVTIKRAAGEIVIDGNGKQIDGGDTITVIRKYTSLDLVYTVDSDSWNII